MLDIFQTDIGERARQIRSGNGEPSPLIPAGERDAMRGFAQKFQTEGIRDFAGSCS